jgi:hypothetical protein
VISGISIPFGINESGLTIYVLRMSYLGVDSVTFPIHTLSTCIGEKASSTPVGNVLMYQRLETMNPSGVISDGNLPDIFDIATFFTSTCDTSSL